MFGADEKITGMTFRVNPPSYRKIPCNNTPIIC